MKILLIGAGSVGTYFCGRAVQGGAELEVVAHRQWEKISAEGYRIKSICGDFSFHPSRVLHSAAEVSSDIDMVILSTKVLPEIDRVSLLKPVADLPSHPPLVLIQNGIGIEEEIVAAFPDNPVISCIAYIGASRSEINHIHHSGAGRLIAGEVNRSSGGKLKKLAELFRAGGVECEISRNIALERWRKLLWNLPFNPLSVLGGGLNTRELCDGGEVESLCSKLMDEVIEVANACQVPLTRAMADEQLEYTRNFPAYKTSMLQDFEAGRPLEVDAVIGNFVAIARRCRINVPAAETCATVLRMADRKNREK